MRRKARDKPGLVRFESAMRLNIHGVTVVGTVQYWLGRVSDSGK